MSTSAPKYVLSFLRSARPRLSRTARHPGRRGPGLISETLERRLFLSATAEGDCGCGMMSDADPQAEVRLGELAAGSAAAPAAAGGVEVAAASPDSDDTTPAGWELWNGQDATFLASRADAGYRITDIEIASTSPLRFNATLVQNSGSHQKGWWWYYGADPAFISQALTDNNARLTDIESYVDNGQQKYAAVMISNTGADAVGWSWYYNVSSTFVDNALATNHSRLTDLDRHNGGTASTLDVIMVDNTGANARGWWYYYGQTPAEINALTAANDARIVDIEPVDSGHFDVVMERSGVSAWWWYYGLTAQDALDTAVQNGARIFDIESYPTGVGTRYAAVMVNNSNAVTTAVGEILRQSNPTADTGLYLKQVGGPVLAGLREGDRFEPASMIKALLNLTAMRAVQGGTAALTDPLFMYYNPSNPYVNFNTPGNPDECPDAYSQTASNRVSLTLQQVLEMMMERSDNRATRTIDQRFGRPLINATADLAGMASTDFASTLGCGVPGNFLTLVDAGRMYEGVVNHTLLNAANADTYFKMMTDSNDADRELVPFGEGVFGPFQTVVRQEAASILGKPASDPQVVTLANRFIAAMTGAWKGGGYTISNGTNWREIRTAGGYVGLPFWGDDGINVVDYVYGVFIDNATVPKSNPTPGEDRLSQAWSDSQGELLRAEIRKALGSWRPTVRGVFVSNTTWTPAFKSYLDARNLGDATYGYDMPAGAAQLTTVPWAVNRVSVRFNQPMDIQAGDASVHGVNVPVYGTLFAYDPATYTATWTLQSPATVDKLLLNVNADGAAGVASTLGLKLDGDWANGADSFPSGNGAQGGDFRFRINVAAGDATRDARVNASDLAGVKQRLNTSSTDPGRTLYNPFSDITGDGRINASDLAAVKQRLNRVLPAGEPAFAAVAASPAAYAGVLFGVKRLDDSSVASELLA